MKLATGEDREVAASVEEMMLALAADIDDAPTAEEREARRAEFADLQSLFNEVVDN